jgi:putative cell wall-binding protein
LPANRQEQELMRATNRLRALVTGAIVATTAVAGLSGLTGAARADSTFTLQRIQGNTRYATAGAVVQAAYPNGAANGTVLLADGLPAHVTDALAASGLEGIDGVGTLLTDNTDSVPADTLAALTANKVQSIVVLGGTGSVSAAQVTELKNKGYSVVQPFAGADRYATMQAIDDTIKPSQVGTDASGLPTAILASGDPSHYVDALAAGPLAYAKKFPVILTDTGPTLNSDAQQVIGALGIKDLIVVGGTASIPASQYNPKPSGVSQVEVEYGNDRSQTSQQLADYAINNGWLKNTNLDLAQGADGADALAGAAFGGVKGYPTVVTNSTSDIGSAASFAAAHQATLTGTSYVFGGTSAVTPAQVQQVANAAGAASPASPGPIAPTSGQVVNAAGSTSFTQAGLSYSYGVNDTYQIDTTSNPVAGASCAASTYSAFQAALSQGDVVTGTYAPGSTSTFCLNDQAPHGPSSVTATGNTTAGGITVAWTAPSTAGTDGITGYTVYRAPATANPVNSQLGYTCPAVQPSQGPASPQTPPPSTYTALQTVPASSGTNNQFVYNDPTATQTSSATAEYCYAVSSVAPNAAGSTQTGTATPASPSSSSTTTPGAVAPGTSTPTITGVSAKGQTITINYNEAINPATVDTNGSDYVINSGVTYNYSSSNGNKITTEQAFVSSAGNQVIVDIDFGTVSGSTVTITPQSGGDGNTVCAAGGTTQCAPTGGGPVTGPVSAAGTTAPVITGVSGSSSAQTVTVNYNQPIDCATVDTSGKQYALTESGTPVPASPTPSKASCTGTTSTTVTLTVTGLLPTGSITVTYNPLGVSSTSSTTAGSATPPSTMGIVAGAAPNAPGLGEPMPDGGTITGSVS